MNGCGTRSESKGTLGGLNQPDTLTVHLEYLRPATVDNAGIAIKDVKKRS